MGSDDTTAYFLGETPALGPRTDSPKHQGEPGVLRGEGIDSSHFKESQGTVDDGSCLGSHHQLPSII